MGTLPSIPATEQAEESVDESWYFVRTQANGCAAKSAKRENGLC